MSDLEEFLALLDRRSIAYSAAWEGDFVEIKFRCGTHDGVIGDPGLTSLFRFNHQGVLSEIENLGHTNVRNNDVREIIGDKPAV